MNNTLRRPFSIVLFACLITACATPYQARGELGGYSESQLQEDQFTVTFFGNGFIDGATVERYALYRCAELTHDRGFDYFTVLRDDKQVGRTASLVGNTAEEVTKVDRSFTIKIGKGAKPADDVNSYDAKFLLASIKVDR